MDHQFSVGSDCIGSLHVPPSDSGHLELCSHDAGAVVHDIRMAAAVIPTVTPAYDSNVQSSFVVSGSHNSVPGVSAAGTMLAGLNHGSTLHGSISSSVSSSQDS